MKRIWIALAGLTVVGVVGCGGEDTADLENARTMSTLSSQQMSEMLNYTPSSPAGLAVTKPTGLDDLKTLVASRSFASRPDPFSLLGEERQFESWQAAERLLSDGGGHLDLWTPSVDTPAVQAIIEEQPYRRLAGIEIGESVSAIIDMGNGSYKIISPGMKIEGTEWRVVSIDNDKAVLRRAGNKLPKLITVRLESPAVSTSAPRTGGNAGAGNTVGAPMDGGKGAQTGGPVGGGGNEIGLD